MSYIKQTVRLKGLERSQELGISAPKEQHSRELYVFSFCLIYARFKPKEASKPETPAGGGLRGKSKDEEKSRLIRQKPVRQ